MLAPAMHICKSLKWNEGHLTSVEIRILFYYEQVVFITKPYVCHHFTNHWF